ncbi:hypothetical protein cypCar_00044187 [Cyprinus carpio]|nr:hypothetical protein cypCar_00044187 [Cyprinus carpio]
MGSGLLPALVNEVLRKDRNPANCQAILNQLVQICSVKELLDILLQQVEEDTDPNAIADTITVLMPLIQSEFKEASRKRSVQSLLVKALGNMPCEAQDKVLQCALVTYDLLESLVVHIEEINEDSQK